VSVSRDPSIESGPGPERESITGSRMEGADDDKAAVVAVDVLAEEYGEEVVALGRSRYPIRSSTCDADVRCAGNHGPAITMRLSPELGSGLSRS
jgi:hypothetical protein